MAAAWQGDAESFSRLCERHYPALVAIAYAQLADRGLAEDAAQEALLIAYRDIAKLKDTGCFLPWLVAICRHTAIDMAKARARERQVGIVDDGSAPAVGRHEDDLVAVMRGVILRLRPDLRDVILLRYYNGMSYEQMAVLLGVSEEAVNGQLRRARKIIRRQWQRHASMEIEP